MKKLSKSLCVLGLSLVLFSCKAGAYSDCYEYLSNNYASTAIHTVEVVNDEPLQKVMSKFLTTMNSKNHCDIPILESKIKCRRINPFRDNSETCYYETNLGYFFITKNYQDIATVIFNRWD